MTEKDSKVKKAIEFIDAKRKDDRDIKLMKLIDEAGMKFNLSPDQTSFLIKMYTKKD
jgi:hypothetical protein